MLDVSSKGGECRQEVDETDELTNELVQVAPNMRAGGSHHQATSSGPESCARSVVDKEFVDKGFGFGKVHRGEIVFIHASAVLGAEVLTIGTDAWVQVVNDDARAQSVGACSLERREGQGEGEQGCSASEASSGANG